MCGRFTTTNADPEKIKESFDLKETPSSDVLTPRYNIAPSQDIAVVAHDENNDNKLGLMRWGLIPSWAKDPKIGYKMINARGETVHEKPSFRTAFKKRRCLIIADGFYEWRKNADGSKTPMYIRMEDGEPFAFAGLWERWENPHSGTLVTTTTIITTTANDLMRDIHERMPVIVPRDMYPTWLSREMQDSDELRHLILPYPADLMTAYPVSKKVNSPNNDSPDLIQRAG
jgi:putative SOS response-associated peptidase YedK